MDLICPDTSPYHRRHKSSTPLCVWQLSSFSGQQKEIKDADLDNAALTDSHSSPLSGRHASHRVAQKKSGSLTCSGKSFKSLPHPPPDHLLTFAWVCLLSHTLLHDTNAVNPSGF